MKKTSRRRGLDRGIAPLLCLGFLSSGSLFLLRAADNWTQVLSQRPDKDGSSTVAGADVARDWAATLADNAPSPASAPMLQRTADNWAQLLADRSGGPAPSEGPGDDPVKDESAGDIAANPPSPAPTPSDNDVLETEGVTPAPKSGPQSQNPILPPLPSTFTTEEAAAGVPLPENPEMEVPFSQWDLAMVETPMFITEAINDFQERPLYLTGNWSVKPHLSIGTFYDGNIFVRSVDTESDFITRVAPGLTMRLGNTDSIFYLVADYTAGLNWYMQHFKESNIDQDGTASFQWSLPRTILGLHLGVSTDTGTDIDATNRVRQHLYFAGVTTHYDLGGKTSLDVNGDYSRTDFSGLISSSQIDTSVFINYDYSPRTQLGVGGAVGHVIVPGTGNQEYEQANLRATYRATGKVTLIAEGGTEFREYSNGEGTSVTPVFSITGAWDAGHGTQVNLALQRATFVSAILSDQDYTATSVNASVIQRVSDSVDVSLTLSYINSDYSAAASNVSASRVDNYYSIRPAVEWRAFDWLSIGLFYEYSQNLSHGQSADPFERDRGGVDFAILF